MRCFIAEASVLGVDSASSSWGILEMWKDEVFLGWFFFSKIPWIWDQTDVRDIDSSRNSSWHVECRLQVSASVVSWLKFGLWKWLLEIRESLLGWYEKHHMLQKRLVNYIPSIFSTDFKMEESDRYEHSRQNMITERSTTAKRKKLYKEVSFLKGAFNCIHF